MPTVVVGVDDHDASRGGLRLAAGLAAGLGAELAVAAAIAGHDGGRRERFERIFEAVDDELGALPHRRFELDRQPAEALRDLAASEHARLLVLGHTHRGTFGAIHPGTLGDRIIGRLACPVVVAPTAYRRGEHDGFGTIGVAYDGGAESKQALTFADELAAALDCALQLLTVEPLYTDADISAAREWTYLERHKAGLRALDRPAEGVFDRGDPAKALSRHAVELDLLVVGSRSHGRVLRAALGSVSSELMRICPCPLVVVPRSAGKPVASTGPSSVSDTDAGGRSR